MRGKRRGDDDGNLTRLVKGGRMTGRFRFSCPPVTFCYFVGEMVLALCVVKQ